VVYAVAYTGPQRDSAAVFSVAMVGQFSRPPHSSTLPPLRGANLSAGIRPARRRATTERPLERGGDGRMGFGQRYFSFIDMADG
jgi:hypothetical protein